MRPQLPLMLPRIRIWLWKVRAEYKYYQASPGASKMMTLLRSFKCFVTGGEVYLAGGGGAR
ncbi:hypothetical protein N7522_002781 [Penicillium canescens]|uniref:Uncharacterized protein n=1 Tax=Penicillium canescens TaxID=5083 RepID=A0AAD6IL20_PENCN|nr:uncharacterized protein N7446_007158 [Penicillium canescens]KAJ6012426.1 hypothetical protein N7522_002781 [Penicillium canescens]KAJ6049513.1 hypothetical protein N7444_006229 [Penicillium canescens]KAJ6052518.1 hypothetical protein N7460_003052 [Penicillium canescens]KAJ6063038.1 hypothetical protein N7446_007158 [Penicillium canescens]